MKRYVQMDTGVVLAAAAVLLAVGGCAPETISSRDLGSMSHHVVGQMLGSQARETSDGYTLETQRPWPTIIELIHVVVPKDGSARSIVDVRASVIHMISFQTLRTDVVYEGPLSEELLDGLRLPKDDESNEFQAALVGFLDARLRESLTPKWIDTEALRNDPYRSRFMGLIHMSLASLSGHGHLKRSRFAADITGAGPASLYLTYLGHDVYRIEMRGSASLPPFPVL